MSFPTLVGLGSSKPDRGPSAADEYYENIYRKHGQAAYLKAKALDWAAGNHRVAADGTYVDKWANLRDVHGKLLKRGDVNQRDWEAIKAVVTNPPTTRDVYNIATGVIESIPLVGDEVVSELDDVIWGTDKADRYKNYQTDDPVVDNSNIVGTGTASLVAPFKQSMRTKYGHGSLLTRPIPSDSLDIGARGYLLPHEMPSRVLVTPPQLATPGVNPNGPVKLEKPSFLPSGIPQFRDPTMENVSTDPYEKSPHVVPKMSRPSPYVVVPRARRKVLSDARTASIWRSRLAEFSLCY